jgi:hypothetical protein
MSKSAKLNRSQKDLATSSFAPSASAAHAFASEALPAPGLPAGTVVVTSERETTVNVAAVTLKVTLVASVIPGPRIVTAAATSAGDRLRFHKGSLTHR